MRRRRKVSLPVGLAFVASVLVHAAIAWLLLVPEAPSRTLGGAVGVAVVFELAGSGERGGAPAGGPGADASPADAAAGDAPAVPPAEPDAVAILRSTAAVAAADVSEQRVEPEESPVVQANTAPPVDAPPVASTPAVAEMSVASIVHEPVSEPEPARDVPAPMPVVAVVPPEAVPVPPAAQPVVEPPPPESHSIVPRRKPVPPEAPAVSTASPPRVAPVMPLANADKFAGIGDAASADESATPGAQLAALAGPARGTADAEPGAAGRAAVRPGGGDGGPGDDFLARLQAWLERHKRYPRRARLRNEEGIVLVRFVLGGDGAVSGVELARSSGHALLDDEATALLQRAQPLPQGRGTGHAGPLRLEVPIRFSLN